MRHATIFHPSRSITVERGPLLSPSVVVLDHEIRIRPHPTGRAEHTPLVIHHGNLADYDLHHLVSTLLGLPGVLAPDVAALGHCAVPLREPDEASRDRLLWTITPDLEIGATSIADSYIRIVRTTPATLITTRQVWLLARVLLSVDAWRHHLAHHTTTLAHALRAAIGAELRAARPLRVRIFHRCLDGAREVFTYTDGGSLTNPDALAKALALFRSGDAPNNGDPDLLAQRYRELGNRPLSVGDIVACGETYYRYTACGWSPIVPPIVIARAVDSPSWTSIDHPR